MSMTKLFILNAAVMAAFFPTSGFSAGSDLTEPVRADCSAQGGFLQFRVAQYSADIDSEVAFSTRAYFYNGVAHIPAPTIVMKAGEQCTVEIHNDLSTSSSIATCSSHSNSFHCADTTNIHTHGLHVSPYEDDVSSSILPGQKRNYTYNLPSDHMAGTHWWHPHKHGSSGLQVMGGMAGALLVEPAEALPSEFASLYSEVNSKVLVLQHFWFGDSDNGATDNPPGAFDMLSIDGMSGEFDPQTITMNASPTPTDFYAVNGLYQPVVEVEAEKVTVLRFVHTSGIRMIEIEVDNDECEMVLLARDGVFQYTPYPTITAVVLLQAGRADVAVKCSSIVANSDVNVRIDANSDRDDILGTTNRYNQNTLFTLRVGSVASSTTDFPTVTIPFPTYLNSLENAVISTGAKEVSEIRLAGAAINDESFQGFEVPEDERYLDELCQNKVYEWTLESGGGDPPPPPPQLRQRRLQPGGGGGGGGGGPGAGAKHPFHMHVNHHQIHSVGDLDESDQQVINVVRQGEWRDTSPAMGITVRFPTKDFPGEYVNHCHVFFHAVRGMFSLMNVTSDPTSAACLAAADDVNDDGGSNNGGGGGGSGDDDNDDVGGSADDDNGTNVNDDDLGTDTNGAPLLVQHPIVLVFAILLVFATKFH